MDRGGAHTLAGRQKFSRRIRRRRQCYAFARREVGECLFGESLLLAFFNLNAASIYGALCNSHASCRFRAFFVHHCLQAVERIAGSADARHHAGCGLGEFGKSTLGLEIADVGFDSVDLRLGIRNRHVAGPDQFFVGRLSVLKLFAVFVQLSLNRLQPECVLGSGISISDPQMRCRLRTNINLLGFELLHLRHETLTQRGMRDKPLVVAGHLLAQIFRFHFQQSFGIAAFNAGNSQTEEAANQVRDSVEHEGRRLVARWTTIIPNEILLRFVRRNKGRLSRERSPSAILVGTMRQGVGPALVLAILLTYPISASTETRSSITIGEKTAGMKRMPGFLPLDWDEKTGKLYLEISRFEQDILYVHSLPWGVGSNDLGLDRGQSGESAVVRFRRIGPKVLLVEPNPRFRSGSNDPAERAAVEQSFPESVLWGFTVQAEESSGVVLVDATEFFMRDAHGVSETLTDLKQGNYKLDPARSAIAPEATKVFPKNTEAEAILTFVADDPPSKNLVGQVTPNAHALTVREHQSFIELPGPGFMPRRFDPRAGYFPASFRDYTTPLGDPLDQNFILRHRLIKKDASCQTDCEPVQPIHYYVDRGAPEPLRSALVEGARWWNQAFTAAGWKDAFQVDVLPEGADPMDVRYNIIHWVHRYTRGWSYGEAVADPRTGEIVRGVVTLGSLRARQDYLIAEALLSPYTDGKPLPSSTDPANNPMLAMVLARIRQLAAHETGHTLGLAHNFAASASSQSASVMDYPHPLIELGDDGTPDLTKAYAINIGEWDKVAIDYGYRQFAPSTDEAAALDGILQKSIQRGLYFITDEDARPKGSAHPHAHLWDNGADAATELERVLAIRKSALERFGLAAIKPGTPDAQLEDTLVVLYLMHRYQTEAAAKEIGGLDYRYALRGDGQKTTEIVSPAEQRKAIGMVLKTLSAETLTLPDHLLQLLPPRPPGLPRTRESFPSDTGLTFDPIAPAEAAADLTLGLLLHPQRAARLIEYHARDPHNPGLEEVLEDLIRATWSARPASGLGLSVQHAVALRVVEAMLTLGADPAASGETKAIVRARLVLLRTQLTGGGPVAASAVERISEFERNPEKFVAVKPIEPPPGMPIGDADDPF